MVATETAVAVGCQGCTMPQNCELPLEQCELERGGVSKSIARQARVARVKELFKTHTVEEIMAELGCSKRTVYNYLEA